MLFEFYGKECLHCKKMEPSIDKLKREEGIVLSRLEVWHNDNNAALMNKYDKDLCGGVPFFYNTETKKYICGEDSYENLKKWAKGE